MASVDVSANDVPHSADVNSPAESIASEILADVIRSPSTDAGVGPTGPDVISTESRSSKVRRWNKISTITIENFKTIETTTVPIADLTILVGPNGSGKSSVLQAIHWAARAASYINLKNQKETIAFDRIDYLPSSEPLGTAHKGELKSSKSTPPTRVIFHHDATAGDEDIQHVTVNIWAARNRGGISAHIEGGNAVTPYKQRETFITAYIPGLAGLSERETILAQPLLRRQAASGDAGGVLRNVLFNLSSKLTSDKDADAGQLRLKRLNELVQEVHPGISITIGFDEREDYNIYAYYRNSGFIDEPRTLETAATGILQVVQICAYLILFRPKLMLIDEPDAHLHPDKQERLVEVLERTSREFDTQIILTTHSPHVARAASPHSRLVWMAKGKVETDDDEAIRRLLGWGGLDKEALFFVEDEDDKAIRAILGQWPDLRRRLAICRCFGIDNLPKDKLLKGLLVDGNLRLKALIHRDRDFMTDEEVEKWTGIYRTSGTFPWVTKECDVEGYFCEAGYLSNLYGVDATKATAWREAAALKVNKAKEKFYEKRKVVNRILWPDGGSPSSDKLWTAGQSSPDTRIGKDIWKAIKQIIKMEKYDDTKLDNFEIPTGFEVATDLKLSIEQALLAPLPSLTPPTPP